MDINQSNVPSGSLHIASEVVEKIAKLAAKEVAGVADITTERDSDIKNVKDILNKIVPQSPVVVEMKNDVADITLHVIVAPGTKIPEVSEKVQKNVKSSVQNMTQISVAKVNVIVTGIAAEVVEESSEHEEIE